MFAVLEINHGEAVKFIFTVAGFVPALKIDLGAAQHHGLGIFDFPIQVSARTSFDLFGFGPEVDRRLAWFFRRRRGGGCLRWGQCKCGGGGFGLSIFFDGSGLLCDLFTYLYPNGIGFAGRSIFGDGQGLDGVVACVGRRPRLRETSQFLLDREINQLEGQVAIDPNFHLFNAFAAGSMAFDLDRFPFREGQSVQGYIDPDPSPCGNGWALTR